MMSIPSLRTRPARLVWGAVVAIAIGASGCPKKPPPDQPDTDTDSQALDASLLQVVAVEPDAIPAQTAATVRVLGSGFVDGAAVQVGGQPATTGWIDENTLSVEVPPMSDGLYDVTVARPDGQQRTLHSALTVGAGVLGSQQACGALTLYFALDQAGLDEAARRALEEPIACWTGQTYRIHIEGHADERGTTDYNLALGQRRADSVRAHLVRSGIPASRIDTISYGEERPVDPASNEAAWARNRRAEVRPGR